MKYKGYGSKVKDVDEKGIVTIYVNAFNNIDSDGDISAPGSFDKTISEGLKRIKHLKDHNPYMLLGLPVEITPDAHGLLVRSAMNMKKQLVKDVYEDYKFFADHDRTLEHSIGYEVIKRDQSDVRIIKEYKLYEYSTLSFLAANPETPLVDIKNAADIYATITLLKDMLKGSYTDEKLATIEKKLSELESLLKEPSPDTPPEPIKISSLINSFNNKFTEKWTLRNF